MFVNRYFTYKKPKQKLYVAAYHDVYDGNEIQSPFKFTRISTYLFEKHLEFYKQHFNILDPQNTESYSWVNNTNKPNLLITFDDGYKSYLTHALPLLRKHNISSVNFLIKNTVLHAAIPWDYLVGHLLNIGRHELLIGAFECTDPSFGLISHLRSSWHPYELLQTTEDILKRQNLIIPDWFLSSKDIEAIEMQYGDIASYGSHTANHTNCAKLNSEELLDEVIHSHMELADNIPSVLPIFAFPFGSNDYFTQKTVDTITNNSTLIPFVLCNNHIPCAVNVINRFNADQQSMFKFFKQIVKIW